MHHMRLWPGITPQGPKAGAFLKSSIVIFELVLSAREQVVREYLYLICYDLSYKINANERFAESVM